MNKEFVPYDQAVALKQLEFDEPCFSVYYNGEYHEHGIQNQFLHEKNECSAPLYQQAFRWFREKYNLHSEILLDQTTQPKYCFKIHKYEDFGNYEEIRIGEWFLYRTPEEAELECIKHLIKVVKGY